MDPSDKFLLDVLKILHCYPDWWRRYLEKLENFRYIPNFLTIDRIYDIHVLQKVRVDILPFE